MRIASPSVAAAYEVDFLELWQSGNIFSTRVNDDGTVHIPDGRRLCRTGRIVSAATP